MSKAEQDIKERWGTSGPQMSVSSQMRYAAAEASRSTVARFALVLFEGRGVKECWRWGLLGELLGGYRALLLLLLLLPQTPTEQSFTFLQ